MLQNFNNREFYLEIDLSHLKDYDSDLHDLVIQRPLEFLPVLEMGVREALLHNFEGSATIVSVPPIQVLFVTDMAATSIRGITVRAAPGVTYDLH